MKIDPNNNLAKFVKLELQRKKITNKWVSPEMGTNTVGETVVFLNESESYRPGDWNASEYLHIVI